MSTARPADVELARWVAAQLHAADPHRLRRVIMIGSRARGCPRPDSDLDLVVVVEWADADRAWEPRDALRERDLIAAKVPPPPVRTDLWVRNTDRYHEACGVLGGVEWVAEREGVEVLSRPYGRAPIIRTGPEAVKREMVTAWVRHALGALEASHDPRRSSAQRGHYASTAASRILTAAMVHRGVWPADGATMTERVQQLRAADPEQGAGLWYLEQGDSVDPLLALRAFEDVLDTFAREHPGQPVFTPERRRAEALWIST